MHVTVLHYRGNRNPRNMLAYPQLRSVETYMIVLSGVTYPVEVISVGADQNGDIFIASLCRKFDRENFNNLKYKNLWMDIISRC